MKRTSEERKFYAIEACLRKLLELGFPQLLDLFFFFPLLLLLVLKFSGLILPKRIQKHSSTLEWMHVSAKWMRFSLYFPVCMCVSVSFVARLGRSFIIIVWKKMKIGWKTVGCPVDSSRIPYRFLHLDLNWRSQCVCVHLKKKYILRGPFVDRRMLCRINWYM